MSSKRVKTMLRKLNGVFHFFTIFLKILVRDFSERICDPDSKFDLLFALRRHLDEIASVYRFFY